MGCFCSKAAPEDEERTVHEEYPARLYSGLQVQVSAAEAGKPALQDWHVHGEATYLFAALCATSKACSRRAHEAFAALGHLPVPDRLQAALQHALPAGGASGCLAYLDAATQRLSLARAGPHAPGANAVLGSLVHGLACQAASASFVFLPVGAGNLWALAAPGDAALRAHFFLHGSAAGAPAAPDENAAPRNGAPAPLPRLPVARHLADYAARRESARLPRDPTAGACSALVLTLRWPARLDTNQAFAAGGGAARGARLWALAKALAVGFPRARRRQLLERWRAVVAAALAAGRKSACKLEEKLWREHGIVAHVSPSLKVRIQDEDGDPGCKPRLLGSPLRLNFTAV